MSDATYALQVAVAARLIGDAGVTAILKKTTDGYPVFAPNQPFAPVFPRIVLEVPQLVPPRGIAIDELFMNLHHYASGADASLVGSKLAGAARDALSAALQVQGFKVTGQTYEGSHSVGDTDPTVQHIVSTFRFLVGPTS